LRQITSQYGWFISFKVSKWKKALLDDVESVVEDKRSRKKGEGVAREGLERKIE